MTSVVINHEQRRRQERRRRQKRRIASTPLLPTTKILRHNILPMILLQVVVLVLLLVVAAATATATHVEKANLRQSQNRNLAVYALYNLDGFVVQFTTKRTEELERAYNEAMKQQQKEKDKNNNREGYTLVSETGGFESSLSYPFRTVTQDLSLIHI